MRKITIYILSCFLLAVACEKDYTIETYNLGTEFSITGSMTSLDDQAVVSVDNPLKNLTAIEVEHEGATDADDNEIIISETDLGTITVSDGAGSITLTETQLGVTQQGEVAHLMLNSTFNGKAINRAHTVAVASPFTTEDPAIMHTDDTYKFHYAIEPIIATVSSVTIQTKDSANGTYVDLAGSWEAIDSISFVGTDYSVGQTIFVRIIAGTGTKTDTNVSELAVSPAGHMSTHPFSLDFVANFAYNLIEGESVDVGSEVADIELTSTEITGGFNLGFVSNHNAEFVPVSDAQYKAADSVYVYTLDFSSAIQAVDSIDVDEATYAYRTRRGSEDWKYGYLRVVKTNKPEGIKDDSSVEFEYKN